MRINYVRDHNDNKIGIVVADGNRIGWSLCSRKDKWNKKLGLLIATNRMKAPLKNNIPDKVFPVLIETIKDEAAVLMEVYCG